MDLNFWLRPSQYHRSEKENMSVRPLIQTEKQREKEDKIPGLNSILALSQQHQAKQTSPTLPLHRTNVHPQNTAGFAPSCKPPKGPSSGEQRIEWWYIHSVEQYSEVKRNYSYSKDCVDRSDIKLIKRAVSRGNIELHHSTLSGSRDKLNLRELKTKMRIKDQYQDKGCLGDGWVRLLTGTEGEATIEGSGNLYVGSNYLGCTHN